jgi:L-fuculose-phosphate aldolase
MAESVNRVAQLGKGLAEYSRLEVFPEDSSPRQTMLELAHLIYSRHLSDSGGGNLSCRVGDRVYITPRYLGELRRFKLSVDDVIVMTLDSEVIEGDPDTVSREGSVHLKVYNTFPDIRAIIHAHPRNIVPFASAGINIPPNTEMFKHLLGTDDVENCDDVGPATDLLSQTVVDRLHRRRQALSHYGAAVMIPNHGLMAVGKNLNYAFCILETVETSAYVYFHTMLLNNFAKA